MNATKVGSCVCDSGLAKDSDGNEIWMLVTVTNDIRIASLTIKSGMMRAEVWEGMPAPSVAIEEILTHVTIQSRVVVRQLFSELLKSCCDLIPGVATI